MEKHTFTKWLYSEVTAARYALISLYEQRDRMMCIERPRLEKEYMEKVGSFEETVIKEELECQLLQKKQQMIQSAINRRQPIDEAAIDAELEQERQKMLQEAAGMEAAQGFGSITTEEGEELQELYREIVRNYHPQMHPELTEVHRQLFQKAQEAYRRRDLEALKMIHEMLSSTQEDEWMLEIMLKLSVDFQEGEEEAWNPDLEYATDYTLAAEMYKHFKPMVTESAIQEEWTRCRQTMDAVMEELEQIKLNFPFTAAEMLSDPAKIEEYKKDLERRLHTATAERERRTKRIRAMIESVAVNE